RLCTEKIELRSLRCQVEIRSIERANGSDVFPITVEHVRLHVTRFDRGWNDMLAEIDARRILSQKTFELFILENVNAHRRQIRPPLCFVRVEPELTCVDLH